MLSFVLKAVLPNSRVCVIEKPVSCSKLWSMLTKLLRSVRCSSLFKGKWRRKNLNGRFNTLPQLHVGLTVSWKLCLNLCSCRWLRPSRIRVIYLIATGFWQSKNELEEGRMNLNMLLLKTLQLSYLLRLGSNLFQSFIAEEKKELLKKSAIEIR